MRSLFHLSDFTPLHPGAILTLGNFDGLHLGHQKLFSTMQTMAGEKVAILFSNHPNLALKKPSPALLTQIETRVALIERWIDTTLLLPFTSKIAQMSAEDFFSWLKAYIPFSHLVLGANAKLGKDRLSDAESLAQIGAKLDFQFIPVAPYLIDNIPVSSTRIRSLVSKGQIEKANQLLGRSYTLQGKVTRGKGQGKKLGFPTLNLPLKADEVHPPGGVWTVQIEWKKQKFMGVANLGTAPTLRVGGPLTLEIHLLDFFQDIYEESIAVEFLHYLRPEIRFASIDELKSQIAQDIATAKTFLSVDSPR